jgi:predicted GIY-YIG superfamily endonuclease
MEEKFKEIISKKRDISLSFNSDLIKKFDDYYDSLMSKEKCFDINKYFGEKSSREVAKKGLIDGKFIDKDWLTKDKNGKFDFKGLYVFINNETPFYFGISRKVLGRIEQHLKRNDHNSASLAFRIGKIQHKEEHPFMDSKEAKVKICEKYLKPIQAFLLEQKLAFITIEDDDELYLFEVFCSLKAQTNLNTFRTH